jgi:hypothetical protein
VKPLVNITPRKVSFMDNISGEIYSEGITFLWIVFMQYFNPKDTKLHWWCNG